MDSSTNHSPARVGGYSNGPTHPTSDQAHLKRIEALEAQLRQAQKLEAIGQLAGGIAHDFNNLLVIIRGHAELLLMEATDPSQQAKDSLNQIIAAAERAANLSRQLLAFGRKQVIQPKPLLLNTVIADLGKMLKRIIGENIDVQFRYAEALPLINADTGMLEQVLVNLILNARDAMPRGGQLVVATEKVTLDDNSARTNPEARAGQFVCLSVMDTGSGIAPDVLPRIFEPFFTTKPLGVGTGLGLATVYGIVKQHQGWIEVASHPGAGAQFKIFLPALPTQAAASGSVEAEPAPRGGTERILFIEDDSAVRLVTRRVLETAGYSVLEADSGRHALELWRTRAGNVDLLLTDIVLPDAITGRDLAQQLRGETPALKVIFISGYSADVAGKDTQFFRKNSRFFLQKPFSSHLLLRTVRQCLDEA